MTLFLLLFTPLKAISMWCPCNQIYMNYMQIRELAFLVMNSLILVLGSRDKRIPGAHWPDILVKTKTHVNIIKQTWKEKRGW